MRAALGAVPGWLQRSGVLVGEHRFRRDWRASSREAIVLSAYSSGCNFRRFWSGTMPGAESSSRSSWPSFWGKLDSLFATIHSRVIGNGKYWSEGWGESQRIAQLTYTHSRRFGPHRSGSLYTDGCSIPQIHWNSGVTTSTGGQQLSILDGEFASPVQVKVCDARSLQPQR
jgi:hypothetical protein